MAIAYPRDLAVKVITRVLSSSEQLDEALASLAGESVPEMRGWLQEVCSGTLRWKGRLDLILDSIALKKKPTGWLRKVLLVGAYQLVVQERTSPGAVVSESVNLVRSKEGEAPAKFCNAVLRKIADQAQRWRELPLDPGARLAERARWGSLPEWLWARLENGYSRDWAEAYARASLERPKLWIRSKDADVVGAKAGPVPGSWELEGGQVTLREGFTEGKFFVQDISSQRLVHDVAERAREEIQGEVHALDLCAAPGGKSIGLAWSGFRVTATDREGARFALLEQTVGRVGEGRVEALDRQKIKGEFDLVWVDAPCSGTGILRRHPDVRWLRQEKELVGLFKVQQSLIREGWERVRPGGFLVYSVCSVLREEGIDAVERAALPGSTRIQSWTLLPQESPHGDGFWASMLKKEKSADSLSRVGRSMEK